MLRSYCYNGTELYSDPFHDQMCRAVRLRSDHAAASRHKEVGVVEVGNAILYGRKVQTEEPLREDVEYGFSRTSVWNEMDGSALFVFKVCVSLPTRFNGQCRLLYIKRRSTAGDHLTLLDTANGSSRSIELSEVELPRQLPPYPAF